MEIKTKTPKCCGKFVELKCMDRHLLNGAGILAYCLFFQCKKCGKVFVIKIDTDTGEVQEG